MTHVLLRPDGDSSVVPLVTTADQGISQCTTGTITGTDLDYSQCAVVKLWQSIIDIH